MFDKMWTKMLEMIELMIILNSPNEKNVKNNVKIF